MPHNKTTLSLTLFFAFLVEDQRFVDRRPDEFSWVSEPLDEDVTVSGRIVAHLFASTTGTDSDWVVKLIDVTRSVMNRIVKWVDIS